MEANLEALECHFTWKLNPIKFRDELEDLITNRTSSWMGHIYNLLGFVYYQLNSMDEALRRFNQAKDAFCLLRNNAKGPWLVVNYGNLAWLYHKLGDEAEAQRYLSKIDALTSEHPPPEVYAEKAWNLMKYGKTQKLLAMYYFNKAIKMQPDKVEWQTSRVVNLVNISKDLREVISADLWEEIREAKERDPASMYLAAYDLIRRAKTGEDIKDEARKLARMIFDKPLTKYSGIEPLQSLFKDHLSIDDLIKVAEEALERYPDARFNKRCTANFYKTKIFHTDDNSPEVINRSISLHLEVIRLYPESSWKKQIYLASIYVKTNQQDKAKQKYEELLQKAADQDHEGKQMLYNYYALNLYFNQKEREKSTKCHMEAARIPHKSFYRDRSIKALEKIQNQNKHPMREEVTRFLAELPTLD
uniref:Interferon-induced protein with tetratricopeptide repeats 1-like n=1 Tax=Oryzias sinensis TaxID=183150 RepID=A0A8C8DR91_9TELE